MSSWPDSDTCGATVTLTPPEVQAGQTLIGLSNYSVMEFIGEGCFGKVAKCKNLDTKETVAVKILKKHTDMDKEISMLNSISVLDSDLSNLVKFFEQFERMGQTCLVFEMLDRSLYDLLKDRDWEPLFVNEIRPIAKQLLVALDVLNDIDILHTDLKPDNVMCVNVQDQPLRVKLIDFGQAIPCSEARLGLEIQPIGYRAPEVALGLPFNHAIDVWGLGCILATLYLADNLFDVNCDYQMMKSMVEVLGLPENHLLSCGGYTKYFFIEEDAAGGWRWRLMTPEEFTCANNMQVQERGSYIDPPSSLEDLLYIYGKEEAAEFEDRKAFVDMLKHLLYLDSNDRISPHEALQHPFITMSHLTELPDRGDYVVTSQSLMSICPVEESADRVNTSIASQHNQGSALGCPVGSTGNASTINVCLGTWPFSGPDTSICCKDGSVVSWNSNGASGDLSEKALVPVSSDGGKDYLTAWYSDGPHPCSYDDNPVAWSSDGTKATDSLGPLKALCNFFHIIGAAFGCCWPDSVED